MKKENNTKSTLLNAFNKSENKKMSEACRIAGVTPSTFYFHYDNDPDFRRQVLEKQLEHLAEKIAAV